MKREVDKQVAAPAVTRTPNLHRAKNRSLRVRMEGWRQWRLGRGEKPCPTKKQKNPLDSDRPSHGRPFRSLTINGKIISKQDDASAKCTTQFRSILQLSRCENATEIPGLRSE